MIFHAEQVLVLRPALERFAEAVDYRLPFTNVILQFDRPVPEHLFFDLERPYQNDPALLAETTRLWEEAGLALHGWTSADGDGVVALLLTQMEFSVVRSKYSSSHNSGVSMMRFNSFMG